MISMFETAQQRRLVAIILASRPPGWLFGPILFGMGLINSRSTPASLLSLAAGAQLLSLSLPLSIIVFGVNDVYDYHSDVRNPRKLVSGLEGGLLSPIYHTSVRLAACISTVLILLASLVTLKPQNWSATILLVIFGWQYSAPPLRLKEVPLVDSITNGMIVFLTWFIGYSFGDGIFSKAPDKGFILSLCTAGVHALGAVVDVESDVAAGQRTIATFLGHRLAAVFGFLTFITALRMEKSYSSIFGAYLLGGSTIMLMPCLILTWSHRAFKAVVYWTLAMSFVWFGSKAGVF